VRVPPPVRGLRPQRARRGRPGRPVSRLTAGLTLLSLALVTAGFAAFAVWSFSVIRGFPADKRPEISKLQPVQIVGHEQTVFDWSRDACEPRDIPDAPARAFRDSSGQVNLIATHYVNRRFVGPSLNSVKHQCGVILNSSFQADPAAYDDRQWLASPYTPDGRRVYALVHDEYQGNEHPGRCATGVYLRCWYNAITFARSNDGGATFHQQPAPRRVVAASPYRYSPDTGAWGLFQPSNIVRNERDGYYYAMIFAQRHRSQQRGTCLIRTRTLGQPGSWRAWDGEDFTVRFADPYRQAQVAAADHVCDPVSFDEIGDMSHSLTYNTYLEKYMLVSPTAQEDRGRTVYGFYYSTSDDLLHWEPRKLIREVSLLSTHKCGERNPVMYPSVLDPRSGSRNFETAGRTAWLYFTRYHYKGCELTLNRDLVRVRVRFSK
jgi:hypothetical protein